METNKGQFVVRKHSGKPFYLRLRDGDVVWDELLERASKWKLRAAADRAATTHGGAVVTLNAKGVPERPRIVYLCACLRSRDDFDMAYWGEVVHGALVLLPPLVTLADQHERLPEDKYELVHDQIEDVQMAMIDLCDHIVVINSEGHIGRQMRKEIEYAQRKGKIVRYLYEHAISKL